jgi:hypothetical protein
VVERKGRGPSRIYRNDAVGDLTIEVSNFILGFTFISCCQYTLKNSPIWADFTLKGKEKG